jgi:prepilin-type N-terminal cleavage/methylation domain-containing protein
LSHNGGSLHGVSGMRNLRVNLRRVTPGECGFTLAELLVAVAVTGLIVAPCVVIYVATLDSWEGTAALADTQRDAWFVIDRIVRTTRGASEVDISGRADSMEVVIRTASGDSVVARYYVDDQDNLVDHNGVVLVSNVDSIRFSNASAGGVDLDVTLTHYMGTPGCKTDDQSVLLSSSVMCRNR